MTVEVPETTTGGTDRAARPGASRPGAWPVVRVLIVVGLVSMWGYVLYLAVGPGRQPPLDRLRDPEFARAAETRCGRALAEIAALPRASESPTATDRAEVLDEANAVYEAMVADIATLQVAVAGERSRVDAWLADWRTLISDRAAYADALRDDPGARLLISEKPGEGRQITGWIDEFASANRMPSCGSPTDA